MTCPEYEVGDVIYANLNHEYLILIVGVSDDMYNIYCMTDLPYTEMSLECEVVRRSVKLNSSKLLEILWM